MVAVEIVDRKRFGMLSHALKLSAKEMRSGRLAGAARSGKRKNTGIVPDKRLSDIANLLMKARFCFIH